MHLVVILLHEVTNCWTKIIAWHFLLWYVDGFIQWEHFIAVSHHPPDRLQIGSLMIVGAETEKHLCLRASWVRPWSYIDLWMLRVVFALSCVWQSLINGISSVRSDSCIYRSDTIDLSLLQPLFHTISQTFHRNYRAYISFFSNDT